MKTVKLTLCALGIYVISSAICYAYDIVPVTNTPDINEADPSVAIFGSTVYAVWDDGKGNVYFDKSTDLGKTWGTHRKIIEVFNQGTAKIFVSKTGKMFVTYYAAGGYNGSVLKRSNDGGRTFYDLDIPRQMRDSRVKFAINKSGTIIYGFGRSYSSQEMLITKSFDGGKTFSKPQPQEMPGDIDATSVEISEDGKYVYIAYIEEVLVDGYTRTGIFFRRSINYGKTFNPPKVIYAAHHWAFNIDTEISEKGALCIAWTFDSYGVFSARWAKSTDKGRNFSLGVISDGPFQGGSTSTGGVFGVYPKLAADKAGNIYATFWKLRKSEYKLYFDRMKTKKKNFGKDRGILNDFDKSDCRGFVMAMSPAGRKLIMMWTRPQENQQADIYCVTSSPNELSAAPSVEGVRPDSGSSVSRETATFTTSCSDLDGWEDIKYVKFIINTVPDGKRCFYGYYSRASNKLYLRNDANTRWLGGGAPSGSDKPIENSYVKLDCSRTAVSIDSIQGDVLNVEWNITFKPAFSGAKKLYLNVKDYAGKETGWVEKGSWTIQ